MQIISGKYKHKVIKSPNDERTHPMGNREKLAIFNILNEEVREKIVLDAFAGTGALGLEALSRGAKSAVFVEKSPKVAKVLKENLKSVLGDDEKNAKIITKDIKSFNSKEKYDLIFADPPYDLYNEAMLVPLEPLLNERAILCLSIPKTAKTPIFEALEEISRREYASSAIIFYKKT